MDRKITYCIFIILLFTLKSLFCQDFDTQIELYLHNLSTFRTVDVKIVPVSMLINGNGEYDLTAKEWLHDVIHIDYISSVYTYGGLNIVTHKELGPDESYGLNFDCEGVGSPPTESRGAFGRGIYKIIYTWDGGVDTIWFEQDAGANYDTRIYFVDNTSANEYGGAGGPGLVYKVLFWKPVPPGAWGPMKAVTLTNRHIKIWDPYFYLSSHPNYISRARDFGDFVYSTNSQIPNAIIPQDSRRDCNAIPEYPQVHDYLYDKQNGNLSLKLSVTKSIHTPTDGEFYEVFLHSVEKPLYLNVLEGATFKITYNAICTLNSLSSNYPGSPSFIMTCKRDGTLIMDPNTRIIVKNDTRLVLECHSILYMHPSAFFSIESGGKFCNLGANVYGVLHVYYSGISNVVVCKPCDEDNIVKDSTIVTLLDSATCDIPDNTTVYFDGPVTALVLKPNVVMNFGSNSKLVFQNGAHLVANHAIFTSLDPNIPWDGIYLSGISNDTLTNCTIENAVNGINVTDKNYSFYGVPSTEISNCTFSNTTNTQLTSAVYVNNSTNLLVKGNNFTSSQLAQGFANGVMIEYCPAGSPLIVDNNIDKVLTGIFVSQSSPYIARNTITGVTGSGKGIELDNSNGTVEYNIVNNFVNSYTSSYSSPYLLKNTFNNASETNLDLYVGSIPVIRPVNSGTLLRWLSGNNIISGSPSNAGISLVEESYPVMDSGFNKIMVGTSDYMSGAIPYSLAGELNAKMNYWYDDPPESQRMAVTGGTVLYDPTFDGSSLPPTDYTELNDIGFGLYDTVYVETLGSDTPSPENLFSQAYQNERTHQFLQAITLYKQVITNYRNSSYAALSLSRIFNCLEKKIGTISDYQLLQTYMSQLRTNNLYPAELREIAEDFIIKAKVKQGMLQSAINDYQTMYEQNQNNHKGIHALINKEILITMLNDTGDAPTGGMNIQKLANHKLKLLSILTGREFIPLTVTNKNQIPHEYKLYQNYPNPFNPKTTIKYDLPKDGFVTFKVYDVLGKELYSISEYKQAGTYQIILDGSNYASGLYFYRLVSGSYVETKKMVLVK